MGEIGGNHEIIIEPEKEVRGLDALAEVILHEKPQYFIVTDAHIFSEPQDITASIIEAISRNPNYSKGQVGFYVEALFDSAKPEAGDFRGDVILWDDEATERSGTNYRGTIQRSVDQEVPVHGIDLDKNMHPDSKERIDHWERIIRDGKEDIKVILAGGGHFWNDQTKPTDLMHRLTGEKWVLRNEKASEMPGIIASIPVDLTPDIATKYTYTILKYK